MLNPLQREDDKHGQDGEDGGVDAEVAKPDAGVGEDLDDELDGHIENQDTEEDLGTKNC